MNSIAKAKWQPHVACVEIAGEEKGYTILPRMSLPSMVIHRISNRLVTICNYCSINVQN